MNKGNMWSVLSPSYNNGGYIFEIGQSQAKLCPFDLYGIEKYEIGFQSLGFIIESIANWARNVQYYTI